jgi:hypothetical protein
MKYDFLLTDKKKRWSSKNNQFLLYSRMGVTCVLLWARLLGWLPDKLPLTTEICCKSVSGEGDEVVTEFGWKLPANSFVECLWGILRSLQESRRVKEAAMPKIRSSQDFHTSQKLPHLFIHTNLVKKSRYLPPSPQPTTKTFSYIWNLISISSSELPMHKFPPRKLPHWYHQRTFPLSISHSWIIFHYKMFVENHKTIESNNRKLFPNRSSIKCRELLEH